MLNRTVLIEQLEEGGIPQELASELIELYLGLQQSFFRDDYEATLLKYGKFSECIFQILQTEMDGEYSDQPDFSELRDALENLPSSDYPESMRLLIPRITKATYDLRSKRGAHKSGLDPSHLDARLAIETAKWSLGELIREYSEADSDEIRRITQQIITRDLPFVEEFEDGDVMLLIDPESCKEEIALLLYHFYPERIETSRIREYLDHQSSSNISSSLSNAVKAKITHRNEGGYKLTLRGREYVEDEYGPRIGGLTENGTG